MAVHVQPGILFTFAPERFSRSPRNPVHLAPESAPRHLLDNDRAAAAAVYTPHGVEKEDEKPPQGNELEASFGELVVAGCRLMAARTDRG
ncbi:MAG TPA: hypothetical protein VMG82_25410 [Candidatus Sulfotelmatobacter sp.]|nr:hypothetical protein [Candidatus Sulfotelmatobacter sp.]